MKINGNLVFNGDATGELQNVYIERVSSNPVVAHTTQKGRMIFNTTAKTYYYSDGTAWVAFATGGNAAALQNEVDALETALGAMINTDGTINTSAYVGTAMSAATTVTEALVALDTAMKGKDTLDEIFPATASGNVIYASGSAWAQAAPGATSGVQAWDAALDSISGLTTSADQMIYTTGSDTYATTGLSSFARTLLDDANQATAQATLGLVPGTDVQVQDATLNGLAALTGTGIVVETATDVFTNRTLVAPAAGVTITNADGTAGNPTFALANDLAALEGLATTGYVVRTGDGTATTRTVTGQSGRIVVSNGDGLASNTDVDLATVTNTNTGTFQKLTIDSYGRVTGTEAVLAADITGLVSGIYVDVAGDTMTGSLTMSGGATVTGLPTPVAGTDAANKNYVDAAVSGLTWKDAVNFIATADFPLSGVVATNKPDGAEPISNGYRVLLTAQTDGTQNGIYVATVSGANFTLARATDADTFGELKGASVFVVEGDTYASTGWVQSNHEITSFAGQTWVQFSGSQAFVWGSGLASAGNTISVNLGAGIAELPTDEIGIDLYSATGALILTTDGTTAGSTDTGAKLHLKLAAAGGLTQDATGLYIAANAITNAMILNDTISLNADSGSGTINLGDTLLVQGSSVQGINTSASGTTVTVTAADAAYAQKGVAKFDANDFTVSAGAVSIKLAGVDNDQLANSTITMAADTGTADPVALGETFSILSGSGTGIATVVSANTVTVSGVDATTTSKGVASFNGSDFTVTGGAVSVIAKDLDNLTDVTITAAAGGQTLVNNGAGQFVNRAIYFLYNGASDTAHVVSHNLGQKYCNVTVVDASDEVVIPQSITFDSANQLTVTFTSAIACKVVVMGVNAGA